MKNVDRLLELNRVDRAISVGIEVFDDLQYACAVKPMKRFCIGMLSTVLGFSKREADFSLRFQRKLAQVI